MAFVDRAVRVSFLVAAAMSYAACALVCGGALVQGPPMSQVAEFEGGRLYKAGGLCTVVLRGNYRQMGRQYGSLLRKEMAELYDAVVKRAFLQEHHLDRGQLVTMANAVFDLYPQRYKELLLGMAETSGLSQEQQLILNASELIPKFNSFTYNCSAIAAWGEYTARGPLVIGRNNDDSMLFKKFAKYTTVTVFVPSDSSIPMAIINYAGVMYAPTGMNKAGLFIELNAGNWGYLYLDRRSIFTTLMSVLQDCATMRQLSAALRSTRPNISAIITAANGEVAYAHECPTHGFKRRCGDHDGLLTVTNHYVDPTWDMARMNDKLSAQTVERRTNLLALGEKYRGKFGPETMMQVLDTPLDKGGATVPGTIYQVIAAPKQLKLWLKVPGVQDWTLVDLQRLFGRRPLRDR